MIIIVGPECKFKGRTPTIHWAELLFSSSLLIYSALDVWRCERVGAVTHSQKGVSALISFLTLLSLCSVTSFLPPSQWHQGDIWSANQPPRVTELCRDESKDPDNQKLRALFVATLRIISRRIEQKVRSKLASKKKLEEGRVFKLADV